MKKFIQKYEYLISLVLLVVFLIGCTSLKKNENIDNQEIIQWDKSIKQGQLDNGMKYYIKKNKEPGNRISLRLVVHVGSTMEEEDQKGVAHFIEHLSFNGTKNFEKNEIINYFETIGMGFGPEVNAYTSFEETVYMLEIPADDLEILKTSLLVLHDWASEVSFDEEEIDKERGVIVEEWRSRHDVYGRINESEIKTILSDSRFEERFPIGDMEVIKNISRERILDFYKKYYRPENMSVVVVGDINVSQIEKELKNVMNTIPSTNQNTLVKKFDVPEVKEKKAVIYKDPELTVTELLLYFNQPEYVPEFTREFNKKEWALNVLMNIMNQRLQEISNSPDSNWLYAKTGNLFITNTRQLYEEEIVPKEGQLEDALKAILDEQDKIVKFGITESELERVKKSFISNLEQNYINKDKNKSTNIADNIVNADLMGTRVISEEDYYRIGKEIISEIDIEYINEIIKEKFIERCDIIYICKPESSKEKITEKEILNIVNSYKNENLIGYKEDEIPEFLVEKPLEKAKIKSSKEIKEFGAKEYVLENGVKIVLKKTDNKKDTINMKAVSYGGTNYISDNDFPSSTIVMDYLILSGFKNISYTNLQKLLQTKQISLSLDIGSTQEIIVGDSNNEDFDYLVQMINLIFTSTSFNNQGWETAFAYYEEKARNYGNSPYDIYFDAIMQTIYGNSIRYKSLDKDFLAKINKEKAEKIFYERFSNIADFTFYFVGDIDEKKVIDSCCYYLGRIPANEKKETVKYLDNNFSNKKEEKTVIKGIDKQGMVSIYFGGQLGKAKDEYEAYKDSQMLNQLGKLLDIVLREVIREDKSGSYGVSVGNFVENNPERNYLFEISFGCDPDREEELKQEVLNQIKRVQEEKIGEEYIKKLTESYKREREINKKNNKWVLSNIINSLFYKTVPLDLVNNDDYIIQQITGEELQKYAKNYLNVEIYKVVFLKPEK